MTRQVIDTVTNHGSYIGDPGKTAWDKANLNFAELYQLFQTAANKLGYFDSAGKPAFTDFTAFARTLLDDSDAATMRGTLGLGSAALYAALGAVGNGAIVEWGVNANGIYVRLVGGFQLCIGRTASKYTSSNGPWGSTGLYYTQSVQVSYPAGFADATKVVVNATAQNIETGWLIPVVANDPSTSSVALVGLSASSGAKGYLGYMATGTWQ